MTRKRYIKMLMAAGIRRNIANKNAEIARSIWSYQVFYDEVMKYMIDMPVSREDLNRVLA